MVVVTETDKVRILVHASAADTDPVMPPSLPLAPSGNTCFLPAPDAVVPTLVGLAGVSCTATGCSSALKIASLGTLCALLEAILHQ